MNLRVSQPVRSTAVALTLGAAASLAAALSIGASSRDFFLLLGFATGGSAAAALLGGLILRPLHTRSVRTQVVAIAGAAIAATVGGIAVAATAMFISSHDFGALMVVTAMSASVGLGAAIQLGAQLDLETRHLRDLTHRLASSDSMSAPPARPTVPELAALADDVADLPRRLEAMRARADALERSRRDLVAWVSHDLRSPLATIRAMAEALDDGLVGDDATRGRYHGQIRRDAERLSALVDDLFELSRIHSGAMTLHRDRIPLHEVVADVLASQQPRAEVRGVRLVDEVADIVVVEVAVAELTRVLHNLIDNAIRHTPPGGDVIVRLSSIEGLAALSVEDQCGGIPPVDLDRVFDVAFRGDAERGRGDEGGGLGLAIAKGLVEACSGDIAVDNHSEGCRFTVTLPLT